MTQLLGALFVNTALGPVSFAGTCIMQQRVKAGLSELSAENLLGGVKRGVQVVADKVGLPETEVSGLLPMARIDALGKRIAEHQVSAAQQWDVHTGHIGGLLDGVASLTDDGRSPNASMCLRRLAAKMAMDKALAKPLSDLAEDLDRWHTLMDTCRAVIDDGASLRSAYRQKRVIRVGMIVAAVLSIAAVAVWFTRVRLARGRVDERIQAEDPCAVRDIPEGDLAKANDEQRSLVAVDLKRCEDAAAEALAREAKEKEERERREQQAREAAERDKKCSDLATTIEGGKPSWNDVPLLGGHASLFERVARGVLEPGDVGADLQGFACREGPAGERIGGVFGRAALAQAASWMRDHRMSESVAALIARGHVHIPDKQKSIFASTVETLATDAVNMGDDDKLTKVVVLCGLCEDFAQPVRQMCRAALKAKGQAQ